MKRKWGLAAGGIILLLLFPYLVTMWVTGEPGPVSAAEIPKSGKVICRTGALGAEEVDLEEYAVGVAAAQMPGNYEAAAVEAQTIIARTYLYKAFGEADSIEESSLSCGYLDPESRAAEWGEEAEAYEEKFRRAAAETAGQVIVYEGGLIEPVFHLASAGMTRDGGGGFPYLRPVDSSGDLEMENFVTIREIGAAQAAEALSGMGGVPVSEADALEIQVASRDSSGYVAGVLVGAEEYTGDEIAEALELPSPAFSVSRTETGLKFVVKGSGHGYGMSQWGANRQALAGQAAEAILTYYFQNTSIENRLDF